VVVEEPVMETVGVEADVLETVITAIIKQHVKFVVPTHLLLVMMGLMTELMMELTTLFKIHPLIPILTLTHQLKPILPLLVTLLLL
jgi:hypothetical protein